MAVMPGTDPEMITLAKKAVTVPTASRESRERERETEAEAEKYR